jgi:hypothetical protein
MADSETQRTLVWDSRSASTVCGNYAKETWVCTIGQDLIFQITELQVALDPNSKEETCWEAFVFRQLEGGRKQLLYYYVPAYLAAEETGFQRCQSKLIDWHATQVSYNHLKLLPALIDPEKYPEPDYDDAWSFCCV